MDMNQRSLEQQSAGSEAVALLPPVDIIEDENGITVTADLPGVSRESLSIDVNGDTLTVEGGVRLGEAREMQNVYAEVRVAQFKRSFVLSRDLDTGKIEASIKNGVLTLKVPKHEQAKPRRIPVKAD